MMIKMYERLIDKYKIRGETNYVTDYMSVIERLHLPVGSEDEKATSVNIVNNLVCKTLGELEDILCGEDGQETFSIESVRELVSAYRDGRIMPLPKDGMVYYIEESGGDRWIGNKPIQDIVIECGWGLAFLPISLDQIGISAFLTRAEAEAAFVMEDPDED